MNCIKTNKGLTSLKEPEGLIGNLHGVTLGLGDILSKLCREVDFWVHSYISRGKSPGGDFLNEISRNKLIFGHLLDKTS